MKTSYINTGIYILEKKALSLMPKIRIFSLEENFFPSMIKESKIYGYPAAGRLIDVGTLRGYKYADIFFKKE